MLLMPIKQRAAASTSLSLVSIVVSSKSDHTPVDEGVIKNSSCIGVSKITSVLKYLNSM